MPNVLMGVVTLTFAVVVLSAQEKEYRPTCNMCPGTEADQRPTFSPTAELQRAAALVPARRLNPRQSPGRGRGNR